MYLVKRFFGGAARRASVSPAPEDPQGTSSDGHGVGVQSASATTRRGAKSSAAPLYAACNPEPDAPRGAPESPTPAPVESHAWVLRGTVKVNRRGTLNLAEHVKDEVVRITGTESLTNKYTPSSGQWGINAISSRPTLGAHLWYRSARFARGRPPRCTTCSGVTRARG